MGQGNEVIRPASPRGSRRLTGERCIDISQRASEQEAMCGLQLRLKSATYNLRFSTYWTAPQRGFSKVISANLSGSCTLQNETQLSTTY